MNALNGRRVASDVISKETGEIIIEVAERINIDIIDRLKEEKVKKLRLLIFPITKKTLISVQPLRSKLILLKRTSKLKKVMTISNSELALLTIHAIMSPGEPTNLENAKAELERLFFNPRTYSLSSVGRYKINSKFGFLKNQKFLQKMILFTL